jgi:glycosyltransferase involved in cell wall biosynthesis
MSPKHGGPPEAVRQMAQAHKEHGVEIEIATLDGPEEAFLKEVPCKVHALGPVRTKYGWSPALLRWLKTYVHEYSGVVINGIWQYHTLASWRATQEKKVPYLVFPHGALDPWFQESYPLKHLKKCLYWRPFQYPALRDAKAVLFTTQTENEQALISFRPNRWNGLVVPYGTNPPTGDPEAHREAFFSHCPALRGRRFLLFIGRIHEKKGCDLLVDAFSRIASATPDLHLVLAGPDQVGLKARLQKQASTLGVSDRVHFPGLLQGDAKWGAFYASEAFILPSHQENFGIAVAEALACAKPVLISNKVNIWQDISTDEVGIVEEDTVEGTHRMLLRWLRLTESQRKTMAEKALRCFTARYSMKAASRFILDLFRQELQQP